MNNFWLHSTLAHLCILIAIIVSIPIFGLHEIFLLFVFTESILVTAGFIVVFGWEIPSRPCQNCGEKALLMASLGVERNVCSNCFILSKGVY